MPTRAVSGSADRSVHEPPIRRCRCRHPGTRRDAGSGSVRATSGNSVRFGTAAGSFRQRDAGARLAEIIRRERLAPAPAGGRRAPGEPWMDTRAWLVALALTVAGCAAMGGYQPTVDPFNDPYAGRIPDDEAECRGSSTRSRLAYASAATMSWTDGPVGGLAEKDEYGHDETTNPSFGVRTRRRRADRRPHGPRCRVGRAAEPWTLAARGSDRADTGRVEAGRGLRGRVVRLPGRPFGREPVAQRHRCPDGGHGDCRRRQGCTRGRRAVRTQPARRRDGGRGG